MRCRKLAVFGAVLLSVLTFWASVAADVVHFTDGRTAEGTIVQTTETTLTLETSAGRVDYPMANVDYVERTAAPSGDGPTNAEAAPQPEGVCTRLLVDRAHGARADRMVSGAALLGLGALFGIVMATTDEDYGLQLGIVTFGLLGLTGLFTLIIPTQTERLATRVMESPAATREGECVASLEGLAEKAKTNRLLGGVANLIVGAAFFFSGSFVLGASFAIEGAYALIILSPEEKMLEAYERAAAASTP